jgi:hypothetical protein
MSKKGELAVLAAGLISLVLFAALPLFFPDIDALPTNYLRNLRLAAGTLYGASATDIATDIVGMRGLASGGDPYPLLGPAVKDLGLQWDLDFYSPRPPTAFLFTAPVAFLPWRTASALWALMMIVCWIFALRLLGLSWNLSTGIGGLLLLWPPAALSLGQLTAPMLLFMVLAYAWRSARPAWAGAAIGVAAMAKYTPAIALLNFLASQKRWRATVGFGLAWAVALGAIFLMNPAAISRYLEVSQGNLLDVTQGVENASPLVISWRAFGWIGGVVWLAFLGAVTVRNWRAIAENSTRGWVVTFYLSVAVLPVLWIYSLLLLLPVAWFLLFQNGNRISQVLILGALFITFLSPAFGVGAIPFVSGTVAVTGLALLFQD